MTGTACYIYGPAGLLVKRTTVDSESTTFYYHSDLLGSTRLVTDSNKNIVSAATYHPFGEPSLKEGSENYLFTGKEKDATGLYYYGARYYDPDLGRFLTRDLLNGIFANPQSLNQYTYCLNNPLKYSDPTGLVEKKFTKEGGEPGGSGGGPEPEEETTEDVEVIDRHDFENGYFENEDGDGFIFLESYLDLLNQVVLKVKNPFPDITYEMPYSSTLSSYCLHFPLFLPFPFVSSSLAIRLENQQ